MTDREFWLAVRQTLLMFLDALERYRLPDVTRTAELRKLMKNETRKELR